MSPVLLCLLGGLTALLAVSVLRRRVSRVAREVLPVLRDGGPLTIPELMDRLGLDRIEARGTIVIAIDSLVRSGRVHEGTVPPNTPTPLRIDVRKYSAL